MHRNEARCLSGFSLIEVLVALTVLAVAVVGISGGLGLSSRVAGTVAHKRQGLEIAQNQLALISGLKAGVITPRTMQVQNFQVSLQPVPLNDGMVRLDAVVTWNSQGRTESIRMSRIILP